MKESQFITRELLLKRGFKKLGEDVLVLGKIKFVQKKLKKGTTGICQWFQYKQEIFRDIIYLHQLEYLIETVNKELNEID